MRRVVSLRVMLRRHMKRIVLSFAVVIAAAGVMLDARVRAQVVLDGSLGQAGPLAGPNVVVPASVGRTIGSSLFHSFSRFDVASGQSVTFQGGGSIQNVLARVTGGFATLIDGKVRCDIPGADLYLINPAGVVFGPGASLEVRGSFAVSTADFVRLGADGRFDARVVGQSVLTTSAPAAFGFAGGAGVTAGAITLNGGSLGVNDGRSISVVGGNVRIVGGQLLTAGPINLVAARSGEAVITSTSQGGIVELSGDAAGGAIELSDFADVDVGGGADGRQGRVTVRGDSLTLRRGGKASSAVDGGAATGEPPPLVIDVRVTGPLEISSGGFFTTGNTGAAPAGSIRVDAASVTIDGAGATGAADDPVFTGIGTQSIGSGSGGRIDIESDSTLRIVNGASVASIAGAGPGGHVRISAGALEVSEGGSVVTRAAGAAPAGDLTIDVAGAVTLQGGQSLLASTTDSRSSGSGGRLTLRSGSLTVRDTALLNTTTRGSGAGGAIVVMVSNDITLDGASKADFTGIRANSEPVAGEPGQAGSVHITAGERNPDGSTRTVGSLNVYNGAGVATITSGARGGGQIAVDVTGVLRINGGGGGGDTGLNAMSVGAGADGGDIDVRAAGGIDLRTGSIAANATNADVAGSGGNITLAGPRLDMFRSRVLAAADVDGGEITITAPQSVHLVDSQIVARARGTGGNITIDPQSVILERSQVNANASLGNGGDITIRAGAFLPSADPETAITASSEFALAGNIEIQAPDTTFTGALVKLSRDFASANASLIPQCGARVTGNVSTFVATGRGGTPLTPGGFQPTLPVVVPGPSR
jgi:filamentous hemagglutinin family protein